MRNRKMKIAYVAGKYRDCRGPHYIFENVVKARDIAAQLWAMGYVVICPHTNTMFMDGIVGKDTVWGEGDKELVIMSDLIVMLPRWEESAGATAERKEALDNNVPVFRWPEHKDVLARIANEPITAVTRQVLQFKVETFDQDKGGLFLNNPRQVHVSVDRGKEELYDVINMDGGMLVLNKAVDEERPYETTTICGGRTHEANTADRKPHKGSVLRTVDKAKDGADATPSGSGEAT